VASRSGSPARITAAARELRGGPVVSQHGALTKLMVSIRIG